jgi:hypothetical protein
MTDVNGGPDPEWGREMDEDFGRLDEPAEQEDPVAEDPEAHGWPMFPSLTERRAT